MPVSFNLLPARMRLNGFNVEFDNSAAWQGMALDAGRCLMVGQMLATGTATALVPVRISSHDAAINLFGRGSMLAEMAGGFKKSNEWGDLWVIPLNDNAAGQAATYKIVVTANSPAAGTLPLYIGGVRLSVGVAVNATASAVASAIAEAINAAVDLPVTATTSGGAGEVIVTARHKGEVYNGLDIRVGYYWGEAAPVGVSLTVTAMQAGSGNPDLADALARMGDTHYHYMVNPYTDGANLATLKTEIEERSGPVKQTECMVFMARAGTFGTLTTFGENQNFEWFSVLGVAKAPTMAHVLAASYGAVAMAALEDDPARPLQTLTLKGFLAPKSEDHLLATERNLLLYGGIASFNLAADGSAMLERTITSYRVNKYGLPDASYLDIETLATLSVLRRTLRARLSQKFPRHKLANDGTNFGPGQAIVTPSIIRTELIDLARGWEYRGWAEDILAFKATALVERNADDPSRVDARINPNLVNQFRRFGGLVQFIV